jgi:hypothetical protein
VSLAALSATVMSLCTIAIQPAYGVSAPPLQTAEVSIGLKNVAPDGYGDRPEISGDGNQVTFDSDSYNMSTDPHGFGRQREVFERDLNAQTTHLVSIGTDGKAANDWTSFSWPDNDGSLVTFTSDATNLVAGKTGGSRAVYLRNTSSTTVNGIAPRTTILVSASPTGAPASGTSSRSMISPNGQFIAYDSSASNLVSTPTNGVSEEYLYNVVTKQTSLVSSDANGIPGNAMSYRGMVANNGQTVTFNAKATNLAPNGADNNGQEDIYLKNMVTGAITWVSVKYPSGAKAGGAARPYMTPDGQWITFSTPSKLLGFMNSWTTAFQNVYLYNTTSGVLTLASPGVGGSPADGDSLRGFVTNDGRYVVFNSFASNLTTTGNVTHGSCFVYDTQTGTTKLVSQGFDGKAANGNSFRPVPSADGNTITYLSEATNLVSGGSAPPPPTPANALAADASIGPNDDESTSYEVFVTSLNGTLPGLDTTAPTGTLSAPAASSTVVSPLTISGTAADNIAVDSVGVSVRDTKTGLYLESNGSFGSTAHNVPATLASPDTNATNWSISVSLPNDPYQLRATVLDTSNNAATPAPTENIIVNTPAHDTHVTGHIKKASLTRIGRKHYRVEVRFKAGEPLKETLSMRQGKRKVGTGHTHSLKTPDVYDLTLSIRKVLHHHGKATLSIALVDRAGNKAVDTVTLKVPTKAHRTTHSS